MVTYDKQDSLDDIFYKFARSFFNVKLLSPYKQLFEIAELKILLNGKIIKRNYRQSFGNMGPIDLILRMNDKPNRF